MGNTIKQRTISSVIDQRIRMSNASFARRLSIGSSWNRLRVGVRWIMSDNGSAPSGTPRFFMGVCSGTTNIFGDATVDNATGLIFTAASWGYLAADHYGSINAAPCKKVGTTLTVGGNFASIFSVGAVETLTQRGVFFVDITKGSPNYSFQMFSVGGTPADQTRTTFLTKMEESTPAIAAYAYDAAVTLAVDEAAGGFDSVNLSWDRSAFVVEICDLAVCKFS